MKHALRAALIILLCAAWLWLTHEGSASSSPGPLAVINALIWPLMALLAMSWKTRWRLAGLAASLTLIALALTYSRALTANLPLLYFAQSTVFMLTLAAFFGLSLNTQEGALCSRIAGMVLGVMTPQLARYGWRLTLVWASFFVASALIGAVLFFGVSAERWFWFANVLSFPLMGLLFAAELVVRRLVLPPELCGGFAQTVQAFKALSRR